MNFKKHELVNIGLSECEVKEILSTNKALEIKDFKNEKDIIFFNGVDGRNFHNIMKIGTDYTTWIKRRVESYNFKENIDFVTFVRTEKGENGYKTFTEYYLSTNMAKELGMIENNEMGKIIRDYFLRCESIVLKLKDWYKEREILKMEYRPLTDAIKENLCTGSINDKFRYSTEANMINNIAFGMTSKQYKEHYNIDEHELLRDYLSDEEIKKLEWLQLKDTTLIELGMSYEERKDKLAQLYNKKFNVGGEQKLMQMT